MKKLKLFMGMVLINKSGMCLFLQT